MSNLSVAGRVAVILYYVGLVCIVAFGIISFIIWNPEYGIGSHIIVTGLVVLFYSIAFALAIYGETRNQKIYGGLFFAFLSLCFLFMIYRDTILISQEFSVHIKELGDPDEIVRKSAAWALGEIGDVKAVDPLIDALKDEEEEVRQSAAYALGKIGDAKAVDPLIDALKDEEGEVRERAAWALGEIGDGKAVDALINALKDQEANVLNSVDALGKIGDKRAVPELVTFLVEHKYYSYSSDVSDALEQLEWKPESEEERVSFFVAKGDRDELQRIWDQTKRVLLRDLESPEYMFGPIRTFISLGNEEIIPILIEELDIHGNENMAELYLNCGHATLESAAYSWAHEHGYNIVHTYGWGSTTWGSW